MASSPTARKRPFLAINEAPVTAWPSIGTQHADCEVHIAQLAADARKLLKLRHRKAVPYEVLTSFLLSCVELSNKYSHQISLQTHLLHGEVNGPPRPADGPTTLADASQDAQTTVSKDSFEEWAEDLAAINGFAAPVDLANGFSPAIKQPVSDRWWEIILRIEPKVLTSIPNISMDKVDARLKDFIAPYMDTGPRVLPVAKPELVARQLKNGNISVRTFSTKELDPLVRELGQWVVGYFGHNTQVYIPTFTVKVTTINRKVFAAATSNSVAVEDELGTLGRLATGDNLDSIPRDNLAAIRWSPSATDSQRILMLEFKNPESANVTISRGIFWNGEVHKAHAFHSLMHFTHCDRCLRYDHEEYACDYDERCVSCAGPHRKEACVQNEPGRRPSPDQRRSKHCANCGGDHQARFESCPSRLAENTRSRLARKEMRNTLCERERPRLLALASSKFYG